jgi:hypothetical protein
MSVTFAGASFLFAGVDTRVSFVIECGLFAVANALSNMPNSHDYNQKLLKWQFVNLQRQGETYRSISERSGVPQTTLCETVNGTTRPFPGTIKKTFLALGLDPKYAFDTDLKKPSQFRLAVL